MAIECPKCQAENTPDSQFCKKCATSLTGGDGPFVSQTRTLQTPPERLTRGTRFADRYEVIEKLGEGGMGAVYRVEDTKVKEEVALKLINPLVASDKRTIERFRNELKFARKIRHKHVCQMFDLGEDVGTHYITMEYVAGEDLKSFLRRSGKLTIETAVRVAKQVCEGLGEAHRLGIVHRDLKPSNIMIDKEGHARIMDFGIARSLKTKGITGAGLVIGTPEYMSPEQAAGEDTDQRSDIYSLGIILFEMVTGRLPFQGETALSVALKHKSEAPLHPQKINPKVSNELSQIILKCLEKEKSERFQSAEEMFSILRDLEKGLLCLNKWSPGRRSLRGRRFGFPFIERRIGLPLLFFIAAIGLGFLIWQLVARNEPTVVISDKPSITILDFRNNTGRTELDYLEESISLFLVTDLEQSSLIRVLPKNQLLEVLRQLNIGSESGYSVEDLNKIMDKGNVNHLLEGYYYLEENTFILAYRLKKTNPSQDLGPFSLKCSIEDGQPAETSSMIDTLTKQVKQLMGLNERQIINDIDVTIGTRFSSSLEANKKYLYGMNYLNEGDIPKSIQSYKDAIAIDPEFATAYSSLAAVYSFFPEYYIEMKEALQNSMKYIDRLPPLNKFSVEGFYYGMVERNIKKALDRYDQGLLLYPDNYLLNNMSASFLEQIEEFDEAIRRCDVNIGNKAPLWTSYANKAFGLCAKGMYEEAVEVITFYLENYREVAYLRYFLPHTYFCQGRIDEAKKELEKSLSIYPEWNPLIRLKGDIFHSQNEFKEAEKEYLKLLSSDEEAAKLWARHWLGNLYLSQGKYNNAIRQIKMAVELAERMQNAIYAGDLHLALANIELLSKNYDRAQEELQISWNIFSREKSIRKQIETNFYKGLVHLELEEIEDVRVIADEIDALVGKDLFKKMKRYRLFLLGMLELQNDNYSGAISNINEALSLQHSQIYDQPDILYNNNQAMFIEALASIYYQSGELERAETEYEKITRLTISRIFYGNIYAKAFYILGIINEQLRSNLKATEYYKKFLNLWKDADPGIAEVEDAKKRLSILLTS